MGCFNYMVILGEVTLAKFDDPFSTCYVDFYASMIKVPFLGSYFNSIMPLFILIFGLLFALLSLFKLKNRALAIYKRFSKSKEEREIEDKKGKKKGNEEIKKDEEDLGMAERILRGEKAILMERDLARKREERNKLLRFAN